VFTDGTVQSIDPDGTKTIVYSNGQTDIIMKDGSRIRKYQDGRVKRTNKNAVKIFDQEEVL
jgi:hypothetical protein